MSKSRPYSAVSVKSVEIEALASQRAGQRCLFGVDVGKLDLMGVLHWSDGTFHRPWRIKSPCEIRIAVEKLALLQKSCPLTVAMESSGSYGDAFRQALGDAQIAVLRVSGKAVKDQSETFDGVPSQHDGKDGAIIADLGMRGKGKKWDLGAASEMGQELRYWVRKLDRAQKVKQVHGGRIESLLARHWPEATQHLESRSATLIEALAHWGDPAALGGDAEAADILAGFGGHYLTAEKIEAVVESARQSVGVRMTGWEVRELKELAEGVLSERKRIRECRRELKRLTAGHAVIEAQEPALGLTTSCVLWMCLGDPRNYPSAAAYRKALGLNLTEYSSGQFKGQLHVSKRGQHLGRKWLYFSAMRWMRDGAVKRWTERKKARDGGNAMRAVVAVMRRLALAAWHVARHGVVFDAQLLFPSGKIAKKSDE